jgi:putative tricarboxylic transport membrane protein
MATALKKISSKDFFSGLCFLSLGLFLSLRWTWPTIWSPAGPEEGFFPLLAGMIIAVCSLFIMGRAVRPKIRRGVEAEAGDDERAANFVKVGSYLLLMALCFGFFFERVGFLITSAFFLFFAFRVVEKQDWSKTILVGAISTFLAYFLFVYFLGVPLPRGLVRF